MGPVVHHSSYSTSSDVTDDVDSAVESDASSLFDMEEDDSVHTSPSPRHPSSTGYSTPSRRQIVSSRRHCPPMTSLEASGRLETVSKLSAVKRRERMLMKPWLQRQADDCTIPNMSWYDDQHTMIRIPWKHGSRSGWTLGDCDLYKAWAIHTGKCSDDEPKRWKANFRCALNSLPDVREVKHLGQTRGKDPFKVYEFINDTMRKPHVNKRTRRCKRSERCSSRADNNMTSCTTSTRPQTYTQQQQRRRKQQQQQEQEQEQVCQYDALSMYNMTSIEINWPVVASEDSVFQTFEVPDYMTTVETFTPPTTTRGGVIPTVVEELSNDEHDLYDMEAVSAVNNLTCCTDSDDMDSSFLSLSPDSSLSESFENIESVIPSWCRTDDYCQSYLPTFVANDDFVSISHHTCRNASSSSS